MCFKKIKKKRQEWDEKRAQYYIDLLKRDKQEYEAKFDKAKADMETAEQNLANSLNEEQRALYEEFVKNRAIFIELVRHRFIYLGY